MSTDQARQVAFDPRAPEQERMEARAEIERAAMPKAMSDLLPNTAIQPVIDFIQEQMEQQEMAKAIGDNVIPFPSYAVRNRKQGMQSVYLDDLQITVQGDYFEKPGLFGFDAMRAMVDQTPILASVILTRIRQVSRFCRVNATNRGPGFRVMLADPEAQMTADQKPEARALEGFLKNCGWESNPRRRQRMKRDPFPSFMAKIVRDTLTMDSAPIETEWKRNKSMGLDGLYAVDGATIRLCTEAGYEGDDEIFALQVVQGQIRAAYSYEDLIYVPRNPRADVMVGGYGMGETELLIRVVTGLLNAFTYNTKFFDSNAIPKGMLTVFGSFDDKDVQAFKRYWNAMVKGADKQWSLPVMISKDQESAAKFEKFGVDTTDAMFTKWMTFLTSIICAIYQIAPDEINFESFTNGTSSLSGSDTEEKITASKDKGLRPLLMYCQDVLNDYVMSEFGDKYVLSFTGLDDEDDDRVFETKKLIQSVNEMRAEQNMEKAHGSWGDAPLNPSLVGSWTAEQQAKQQQQQQDFGMPGAEQPGAGEPADFGGDGGDDDFGELPGGGAGGGPPGQEDEAAVAKAFGLPVYKLS